MKVSRFLPIVVTFPSVVIGAIAMKYNGIATIIWSQNLIGLLVIALISYYILPRKPKTEGKKAIMVISFK